MTELPQSKMPPSLKKTGLDFYGARSKNFTHWVVDSMDDAKATLQWAERCFGLLREYAGNDMPRGTESWASDPDVDGRSAAFNHARVANVENAGHWVHHDQLDVFCKLVDEFLAE